MISFYCQSEEEHIYGKKNLIELSKSAGEHWSETFLRLSRDSNGRGLFNWRMFAGNLKEQGDLFASENLIPGLGDVGAHDSGVDEHCGGHDGHDVMVDRQYQYGKDVS